jgi:lysophospholipase L1-like esterase
MDAYYYPDQPDFRGHWGTVGAELQTSYNIRTINLSSPGQKIGGAWRNRLDNTVRYLTTADQPTAVIIQLGANDAFTPVATFRKQYASLLYGLLFTPAHVRVYCMLPFRNVSDLYRRNLEDRRDVIRELAAMEFGCELIDTTTWLNEKDTVDGIHLNYNGHYTLLQKLLPYLQ